MLVEQHGKDVWRGRHRSVHDALEAGEAGIGVDKVLVQRAKTHDVGTVIVVVEEQRRIFLTPLADFEDETLVRTRSDYRGRAVRIVPYQRFHQKYLAASLRKRKRRASA